MKNMQSCLSLFFHKKYHLLVLYLCTKLLYQIMCFQALKSAVHLKNNVFQIVEYLKMYANKYQIN